MKYLIGPNPRHPRQFYLLTKIYKDPQVWTVPFEVPPGCPIVLDCGSESYNSAQYINHFLNPLSQLHTSYLKDTYDFVSKIKSQTFPNHSFLFAIDIDSLHTNISTELGIKVVKDLFHRYPNPGRPNNEVLTILDINLARNDFQFNSQRFLQVHGTAMGKKFAPAYANIYMTHWENTLFHKLS